MQPPPTADDFYNYWGKAQGGWHLLAFHSLDVAACALQLFRRHERLRKSLLAATGLPEASFETCLPWAAALHDLGKFSPGFQWKAPEVAAALGQSRTDLGSDIRHDNLGYAFWRNQVEKWLPWPNSAKREARIWLQCAMGHHGTPPALQPKGHPPIRTTLYFDAQASGACESWAKRINQMFSPDFGCSDHARLQKGSWWIAGLITLADWLGSSTEWFPYQSEPEQLETYFSAALHKATLAIDESGIATQSAKRSFAQIFPTYVPTDMQRAVSSLDCDGDFLMIVEEATGGGKTEAAIGAAGGTAFYFALPTMATANGLWARVGEIGGQQALLHGKRWLMPRAMQRATAWINDGSRKAMLSTIGVGTVDQAMLSALYSRFSTLRLAGLASRALIIDEVHAYDPYMTEILTRLVEMHARAGGPVILLSATMPLAVRQTFAHAWARGREQPPPAFTSTAFPLISFAGNGKVIQYEATSYRQKTYHVKRVHEFDTVVEGITQAASEGRCVCWIRNSVREAIQGFDALRTLGVDVDLFHARFTAGDRQSIEERVLRTFGKKSTAGERSKKVLVATQVVEQSLDLDFDLLVSDLAPVDLMIQRAGRLHRHERGDRGPARLVVYCPADTTPDANWVPAWSKATALVYPDHGRLWLSLKELGDEFSMPADARRLVEAVYGENASRNIPDGLQSESEKARAGRLRSSLAGSTNAISLSGGYADDGTPHWDDERAPTRLGSPSQEWVVFEDGFPINGSVEMSSLSIPVHRLSKAPSVSWDGAGSWRKALGLTQGKARCERSGGEVFEITYDRSRGLTW
jgi:CRISPR-associated endonuclease/helicase Cas3